jgi:hypothetical protein
MLARHSKLLLLVLIIITITTITLFTPIHLTTIITT